MFLGEDEDDEHAEDGDSHASSSPPSQTLTLTQWLRFGEPDFGDRFLIDYRVQYDIVPTTQTIAAFAEIYGFTTEQRAAFVEHCRIWRRFLREVVDPRFEATERFHTAD